MGKPGTPGTCKPLASGPQWFVDSPAQLSGVKHIIEGEDLSGLFDANQWEGNIEFDMEEQQLSYEHDNFRRDHFTCLVPMSRDCRNVPCTQSFTSRQVFAHEVTAEQELIRHGQRLDDTRRVQGSLRSAQL